MRIRVVSPEEVQAALAALRERHGATGYDGRGPPTETSIGLTKKRFVTLPEDLLELLVTVQPHKLTLFRCRALKELPAGVPAHSPPSVTPELCLNRSGHNSPCRPGLFGMN